MIRSDIALDYSMSAMYVLVKINWNAFECQLFTVFVHIYMWSQIFLEWLFFAVLSFEDIFSKIYQNMNLSKIFGGFRGHT